MSREMNLDVPDGNLSRRSSMTSSQGSEAQIDEFELEALLYRDDMAGDENVGDHSDIDIEIEVAEKEHALSGSMGMLLDDISSYQETLHKAAFCGNMELLAMLYKDGADINARDNYGQTALHCAILGKQHEAARFLLNRKARVHVLDDKQDTPVHVAVRMGDLDLLKELLIDPHADVNFKGPDQLSALHIAVQTDHENVKSICQLLLLAGADVSARDVNNRTPLCLAIIKGAHEVVDCLFRHANAHKRYDINELLYGVDLNGSTLLHLAVDTGQTQIVELCIRYGARVDYVKESDGTTPIHMACTYGSLDILNILLSSVNYVYSYSLADKQGFTCLHRAAMFDHEDIVRFLLKQGIEVNDLDLELRTPLHLAASRGCTRTVEVLLQTGADCNIKDAKNRTIIHSAVGHSDTLAALLKSVYVRELLVEVDEHGATALHYAAQGGFLKNVSLLTKKWRRQVSDNFVATRIRNHKGELPLHLAASHGWLDVVNKLLEVRDFRQLESVDDMERTPLFRAAEMGHTEVVTALLQSGANINKDRDGRTPLHAATIVGSLRCLAQIIHSKPGTINDQDKEQNTALHLAAQGGHANLVKFLLSINSSKVLLNAYNQNVLDVALSMEHAEVALVLADHKRWREVLRRSTRSSPSQIQLMVRSSPHVADKFLDNCVTEEGSPESPNYKIKYDFRMLQGMPDENEPSRASLDALETMVKYKRLDCLTHPLCQAFLDIKWRKVGLNEIIPQSILFFTYILTLGNFILYQPCGISERRPQKSIHNYSCVDGNILLYGTWPFEARVDHLTRLRVMYWICLTICSLRVPKEISIMKQGMVRYVTDMENVFNFVVMVATFIFFLYVIPFGRPDVGQRASAGYILTVLLVICSGIIYIKHLRSYKVFGLYITMVMKIIKTFLRVIILLIMFILAFAFSFYMMNVDTDRLVFRSLFQSVCTTFVWMLGEFEYKSTFVDSPPTFQPVLFYFFFIMFGVSVPIIFLNLLIGLAVGDIGRIQASAELEVHARQVERLIQIERGAPKVILKRSKVTEHLEFPNAKGTIRKKIVDIIVSWITQRREDKKQDTLTARLDKHQQRLDEMNALITRQSNQFVHIMQSMRRIEEFLSSPSSYDATSTSSLG
ncbi:transient receptor potential cation channel subfamily A member 1 isoform X2 [Nematostella vectensis]|uniref:transient receptor potential cation channel subfamily A member 1 isoform X2 n=1 Tax=Nematostella vectensis TaxID=45351 RepID=UPI002076EA56|nr:transient receptor potential cation channel subfamily A member 1 isoform X2 [Nematostella vectensis]